MYFLAEDGYTILSGPLTVPTGLAGTNYFYGAAITYDGQRIITVFGTYIRVFERNPDDTFSLQTNPDNPFTVTSDANCVTVSPDGNTVIAVGDNAPYYTLYTYDGTKYVRQVAPITISTKSAFAFSPDGTLLAIVPLGGTYPIRTLRLVEGVWTETTEFPTTTGRFYNGIFIDNDTFIGVYNLKGHISTLL